MIFPTDLASILLLFLLIITPLLALLFALRSRTAAPASVRPLPGVDRLRRDFGAAAEGGRPLHIATGTNGGSGALAGPTAESLASLLIAQRVAEETTRRGGSVAATSGDAVAHAALRGTIHSAYRQAGYGPDYAPDSVQLAAQGTPVAYAAAVAARYAADAPAAAVVAGGYGAEALLITAEGADNDVPQLAAATSLAALPVLALSADAVLVGEELFAAEAYLSDGAAPKARLLTHDALRWVMLVLLLGGLLWQVAALAMGLAPIG